MKNVLTLIVAVVLLTCCSVIWADYTVGNWTVTQVTDNDYADEYPRVSGSKVTWSATPEIGRGWEVFVYDAPTQIITRVTDNSVHDVQPRISGSNVVWSGDTPRRGQVFLYDCSTQVTTQITADYVGGTLPEVSGSNIAWEGSIGNDADIFFYNGSTQVISLLTDNKTPDNNVRVSGDTAVWVNGGDIFLSKDAGAVIGVTSDAYGRNDMFPEISGKNVIWSSYDGTDWDVFWYNGVVTKALSDNSYHDQEQQISGSRVVWTASSGVYPDYQNEIILHDVSTNVAMSLPMPTGNSSCYEPHVSDSTVVWGGSGRGFGETDLEILAYDGSITTQLTDNMRADVHPQVSGTTVVWQHYDGNDYEIFMATYAQPVGVDFGDAPELVTGSYPTLLSSNGAQHTIGGPWLGDDDDGPDADDNGQPEPSAAGDDNDGNDDEEGVHIGVLTEGRAAIVDFRVNGGGGVVSGWIDFNGNARWDASEQVVAGYYPDGAHSVMIDVPRRTAGETFARFRICDKALEPVGPASGGEVEDHKVVIRPYLALDHFEPNNKIGQAVDLGVFGQRRIGLGIHESGDEDWYQWTAVSTGDLRVDLSFSHAAGDLQLELYDAEGRLIAGSESNDDDEKVGIHAIAGARYFVRVFGADLAVNPEYILDVLYGDSDNYAVLFAGGIRIAKNFTRYYDNVKDMHDLLVDEYGLDPANIYVLYADGTDPNDDLTSGNQTSNSDMSYAQNVMAGTNANLEDVLTNILGDKLDLNDHFFLWTFDHGGGTFDDPDDIGEEALSGWGDNVRDDELAAWLGDIDAGRQTFVFGQCFAGGMLAALDPLANNMHGCSATNHYEYSWGDAFVAAYLDGLRNHNNTHDAYQYAYDHDGCATDGEGPGGDVGDQIEHPWELTATKFPIFAENTNHLPWIDGMRTVRFVPPWEEVMIPYELLRGASKAGDPDLRQVSFRVESVPSGILLKGKQPVIPGETLLGPGESLRFRPSLSGPNANMMPAPSQVFNAFTVRAYDGVTVSDQSVSVPIVFTDDWPTQAVDDTAVVGEDAVDAIIDVLANDDGRDPLSVVSVGVATHGTVRLAAGQVLYSPAAEYSGHDSFIYFMTDTSGDPDWATVFVTVEAINDKPEAYADRFIVLTDSTDNMIDVLENDFDAETKPHTYFVEQSGPYPISAVITREPSHGSLVRTDDGRFLYTPQAGFSGDDSFAYHADDGDSLSDGADAIIRVILCPEPSSDFDGNGIVDAKDLDFFSYRWLSVGSSLDLEVRDLDCDGYVRWPDFAILASQWLQRSP